MCRFCGRRGALCTGLHKHAQVWQAKRLGHLGGQISLCELTRVLFDVCSHVCAMSCLCYHMCDLICLHMCALVMCTSHVYVCSCALKCALISVLSFVRSHVFACICVLSCVCSRMLKLRVVFHRCLGLLIVDICFGPLARNIFTYSRCVAT